MTEGESHNMATTTFSAQLQTLRKKRQITQEQLANYLGVSSQAVSKWENGSYPDGDLLPKIADYFDVTIDYLYGRAKGETSLEQLIMESLRNLEGDTSDNHLKRIEKMMEYFWAMQMGAWANQEEYHERPVYDATAGVTASCFIDKAGFTTMRLNKDLEFYFVMKQPQGGFEKYFQINNRLVELFRFLGDHENLKILFYMISLNSSEMVRATTIEKRLGVSKEKVKKALDYLCHMEDTGMFYEGSIVDDQDRENIVYGAKWMRTSAVLILLTGADFMLHQPVSYQMQIGPRNEGWMKRSNLDFLKTQEEL